MPPSTDDDQPLDPLPAGTEPAAPREPDPVVAERRAAEQAAREEDGDPERDEALSSGTEHESGYSTEIEQGAAQPRPEGT
jgi:hypothetical protein